MRNFRLAIEYDGTDFHGWQVQPGPRTVQGTLARALEKQVGETIKLMGAGRTDSGVHAVGQTASFASHTPLTPEAVARGTGSLLPPDVCIRDAWEVDLDFDARRSCTGRTYHYTIISRRSPLRERYAAVIKYKLKLDPMQEAAELIIGEHDFTSFAVKNGRDGAPSAVCRLTTAQWSVEADGIRFEVRANRFLRGMVRALVGTMLEVGRGRIAPERMENILYAKDRAQAGPAAPPQGLCLARTEYSSYDS
ncbi:tRNA pseudouridine(38-40) synthase TruA [candidate division KSB1 bacterium]